MDRLRLIDTHCHLEDVEGRPESVLAEARAAGVSDVVAMGVDAETSRQAAAWAERFPGLWAAVGHHPLNQQGPDLELLRELAVRPAVLAIGEIGLDFVDENRGPHDLQPQWFAACCELALEMELPVCVHIRGSEREVCDQLRRYPGLSGVVHYWSLPWEWAERFLEAGFYLSFAGTVTRAAKQEVREVARKAPADRLLIETDAPWGITRGRSGGMRPAWMIDTARTLAEIREISIEELDRLQRQNAERLFTRLRA